MSRYSYIYCDLLGKVPAADIALLQEAEDLHWTNIYPEKAATAEAARALDDMIKVKYRREESRC
ncbi:MAG: hypothetical protein HDS56_07185 [Barnesiella sp.]|nr:hypothetical protein [Barnesiella sp.]